MITSDGDPQMETRLRDDFVIDANARAERWKRRYEEKTRELEALQESLKKHH